MRSWGLIDACFAHVIIMPVAPTERRADTPPFSLTT